MDIGKESDHRPKRGAWAPGDYWHRACCDCAQPFTGDKRAMSCADCAYKMPDPAELQRRFDVADEMLAKLIGDIGTGSGVASLRAQALAVKHELRGLRR